jgi:hypothetical protein
LCVFSGLKLRNWSRVTAMVRAAAAVSHNRQYLHHIRLKASFGNGRLVKGGSGREETGQKSVCAALSIGVS